MFTEPFLSGVKRPGRELGIYFDLDSNLGYVKLYHHSALQFIVVVFNHKKIHLC
jgi:hypothetical protein